MTEPAHDELIKQLQALGIPDWSTARHLMTEAAKAIASLIKKKERETARADSWVAEARNLAKTLGLPNDDSNGSIADWKHINAKVAALIKAKEDAEAERDAIKQQAQCWKHEANAQKATVQEIYQLCTGATGEPGDWNGAEPVRAIVAERNALQAENTELRARIAQMEGQEPYRWLCFGQMFVEKPVEATSTPLYLAPGAAPK